MATHTYRALRAGYVDAEVKPEGSVFTTEFKGVKRKEPKPGSDGVGEIERDKSGNPIMVTIPDPSWVERISAADAVAIDASTNPTPDDINVDAMSPAELTAYGASIGVDLTGVSKKADMLTAIKAARPPAI